MKRVVYTCIFSSYDNLLEPVVMPGWDYVCFTDQDLQSDVYRIVKLPKGGPFMSRDIKMLPHKWLPNYNLWFYFDGSLAISKPFEIITKNEWIGYKHRCLDPWDEFDRIVSANKGDLGIVMRQLDDYSEEIESGLGHMAGGVLYRKNTEKVRKLNEAWWNEYKKYPSRDQIALYKVLHNSKVNWGFLNNYINMADFTYQEHVCVGTNRNPDGNIYEFTPSGVGENFKDYGRALNMHCSLVPFDEDWIVIRDQDSLYFPGDYRKIIREATIKHPNCGIFGAYTNRIGLKWQLIDEKRNDSTNIMELYEISRERSEKYGSECETVNKPIAGFFMMFKKGTWKNAKFQEGDFSKCPVLFDWDFSQRVISMGLNTMLIKGLYLFHFYRMQQDDIRDTNHLFS